MVALPLLLVRRRPAVRGWMCQLVGVVEQWPRAMPWARAIWWRKHKKRKKYLLLNGFPAVGGWRLVVVMVVEKG